MDKACYRELRKYKYQLVEDYDLPIDIRPAADINERFVSLSAGGRLTVRKAYAWDGPSGPTIDTLNFMRGSLVHDALYQLMRMGKLDYRVHREPADRLLQRLCREDGMSALRAWWVYQGVHLFGEANARPTDEPEDEIICVPPEPEAAPPPGEGGGG